MRAMVTGGAGFIGSHLVDALLARGDEVHVVDNLTTGSCENLGDAAELHELDIRDESFEQVAGKLEPEVVFHLAAQADVGTSVERPAFAAGASSSGGAVFNVGSGVATTVLELHRLCAETAGVEQEPRFGAGRPGDLRRSVIDPSRAARELDWRARTTLGAGLAKTWAA